MANFPRIALVVPSLLDSGGVPAVAHFVSEIIKNSARYDIKVISLSSSSDDSDSALLRRPWSFFKGPSLSSDSWRGESIVSVGAWAGELEFMRYQNRKILTNEVSSCDLIQVVCGSPAWANPFIGLGKPISIQCATLAKVERRRRDAKPVGLKGYLRKYMTVITDYLDRRALLHADAIQVENPWMLSYCNNLIENKEVDLRYAPPGVDSNIFKPLEKRVFSEQSYILCVARLSDPRKNVELLLEAYAQIPDWQRNKHRLVLAGSCAPPEHFWKRAEQLGLTQRINYVVKPNQEELIQLYQNASTFVLPSDEEGLGVVILEAMSCGIPVVSTRSGGPDGIISDGIDGYLTPLNDAVDMANKISRILSDDSLNIEMGKAARETILKRYENTVAAREFLDTWNKLLGKGL